MSALLTQVEGTRLCKPAFEGTHDAGVWYDVELYADELERKRARHALRQVVNVQLDLVRHGRWAEKFSRPLPLCSPAVPLVPLLLYEGELRMLSSTTARYGSTLQGFPGARNGDGPIRRSALRPCPLYAPRVLVSPLACYMYVQYRYLPLQYMYAAAEATVLSHF